MTAARPYVPRPGERAPVTPRFKQSKAVRLRIWWREIDRVLLALVLCVMALGSVAVAAASPASARRLKIDDLHFLWAHLGYQAIGIGAMIGVSMAPRDLARRGGIVLGATMLVFLMFVPIAGAEVNGARRWIDLGIRFQPSEFLKPAYAVLVAWILSWKLRDPTLPVIGASAGLMALVVALLMAQPDLGDAILFVGAWLIVAMLAGMPMKRIMMAGGAGVGALVLAYLFYENARHRIDSFLGGGTAFDQVDLASRTLLAGGWTGAGLWLGQRKMQLPEAHTDYIFSVIGEEFGLLVCGLVVLLYLAIVLKVIIRLVEEENLFTVLASSALITLFGGQAFINILVNLQLFPSKGMTLPLISYGGSSTIAQCVTIGLLLALTRRNPFLSREGMGLAGALERAEKRR
jgi:cell division protein FtsW